jgi:hypothetical protein
MTEQQQESAEDQEGRPVFVFIDDDGEEHEYDGDPMHLKFKQLDVMQKLTGLNGLLPIMEALGEMNSLALKAFLWVHRKGPQMDDEPSLVFADLADLSLGQIQMRKVVDDETPKDSAETGYPSPTTAISESESGSTPSSDSTSGYDPVTSPI